MDNLALHLRIIGILMIGLALVHAGFPKRFGWAAELKSLSLINRQMMQVHTFFIALLVALNGLLFVCNAEDLLQPSPLARSIVVGLLVFWGFRLFFQFFVYDSALWRGKRFETSVHILFGLLWLYCLAVLALLLVNQLKMRV